MEVIFQGHVAINGSTKIVCTTTSLHIESIIINNIDSNYVFSFNRYMTGPGIHSLPIYELHLDAGDTIRDTEPYTLVNGNYLHFKSDVVGTTYYVKATQI